MVLRLRALTGGGPMRVPGAVRLGRGRVLGGILASCMTACAFLVPVVPVTASNSPALVLADEGTGSTITTVAGGTGSGPATNVSQVPNAVVVSGHTAYVADAQNNVVRALDLVTGTETTIAGDGAVDPSAASGPATSSPLFEPEGLALDSQGNLYIAEPVSCQVAEVDLSTGDISQATGPSPPFCGNGGYSYAPYALAFDSAGNLFMTDADGHVYKVDISTGTVTVFAGGGSPASGNGDGGQAISARLVEPDALAFDSQGNLYIGEQGDVRVVDAATGDIETYAGGGSPTSGNGDGGAATAASISNVAGIAFDASGNLYLSEGTLLGLGTISSPYSGSPDPRVRG